RLDIDVVGIRGCPEALARDARRRARVDVDELLGMRDGQRPEQHTVHDGEQGRVEADADRQRGDRDGREPRTLDQPAQREPNVGQKRLEHYNRRRGKGDTMIRRSAALLLTACTVLVIQAAPPPLTPDALLSYPFPDELIASPAGSAIAWTFNERGVRNIYAADAPEFRARRITTYNEDDGQELTNLAFTDDGETIVYVRGGDHGANW